MTTGKNSIHSLSKRYHKITCETLLRLSKSNQKYDFAIDYTNDLYMVKQMFPIQGMYTRTRKKSTNSFYSYISLYIIDKNKRFTLSAPPVKKSKPKIGSLPTSCV